MFEKGQKLRVDVVEIHVDGEMLVGYRGHLFRVKNTSDRQFKPGDKLILVCVGRNPLEFSLAGEPGLYSRWV
jgi:hypothetical protein